MRFRRNLKPFTGRLDAAPFAGVFFLLVLFLLLQSALAPPPGIRVQLPRVDLPEAPVPPHPVLVVTIDQNQLVYFDHQVTTEMELRERLTQKVGQSREPLTLLIQADDAVRQGAVVRLTALARQAGIREVLIGTRPSLFPAPAATASRP